MFRRVLSIGVFGGLLSLGLSGSVLADTGGGGFGAPGTHTFTDVSASAGFIDSVGFVSLNVDRGMQTFKLKNTSGPPVMFGPETVLNVSVALVPPAPGQPGGSESGCFVILDSAFTVAAGIASAALNVGPAQETACPGEPIPASAGGRPGLAAPAPLGSQPPPPPPPTTISSVTANLTWSSNGVISTSRFTFGNKCLTFVSNTQGDSQSTVARATGTVSLLSNAAIFQFGSIAQFDSTQVITGSLSPACIGGFGP